MLELYAAGALTSPEAEEVEQMVALHPDVKAALSEIQGSLEQYALLHAISPKAGLKDAILSRIPEVQDQIEDTEEPDESRTIPFTPVAETYLEEEEYQEDFEEGAKVRTLASAEEGRSGFRLALVASVALLALSMLGNFYFYSNWKQTENQLAAANSREQQYVRTYRSIENLLVQRDQELAVLRDPRFQPVQMQGQPFSPSSSGTVYWNSQSRQVYVSVENLPAPPSGFQYQLWALDGGQPVDAGVFSLEQQGPQLQSMKSIGRAQAFAVTLEPEGGSEKPTLENLVMMGNLGES